mgnify:CR=1 FL=1
MVELWEKGEREMKATEKQKDYLRGLGELEERISSLSKKDASSLIGRILFRRGGGKVRLITPDKYCRRLLYGSGHYSPKRSQRGAVRGSG